MVKNIYHWSLDERFTPDQMHQIQAAGLDLEIFINNMTGGRGREWIIARTQGTRVHRGGVPTKVAARFTGLPTSLVFPYNDIWLYENFDRFHMPKRHFLHELGHVVENRLPHKYPLLSTVFGGGVSDRLTHFLGGKPTGLRFMNGISGIPERFQWHGLGVYGNHATADYFAGAFSWLPYDMAALPDPLIAQWFTTEVLTI